MKINTRKITTYLLFPFFLLTPTVMPIKLKPNTSLLGKIKLAIGKRGWIEKGTVTAIPGTTFTVTKDSVTYTVSTDSKTIFRRRFGGKSTLSEISESDTVNVLGKWQNEEKSQLLATHVRDLSIQKRHATFFGTVKSKGVGTLTLTTLKRGVQTVTISTLTKLVNRKMEEIKLSDIEIGHRIRVKGIWDLTNKTVTEVKQIKDFTIPVVKTSPTATPTP